MPAGLGQRGDRRGVSSRPGTRPGVGGRQGSGRQANGQPPVERRRKDGLGLLPRATTVREQQVRQRANTLVGILLIVTGGATEGASLAFMQLGDAPMAWLALLLGLVMIAQGVLLVGRRERRRTDRS